MTTEELAIHHYHLSSPSVREQGAAWYPNAASCARGLATRGGTTFHRAAGIIAALSPRNTWQGNVLMAHRFLARQYQDGAFVGTAWGAAHHIDEGARPLQALRGRKTREFYRAITGDRDAVVLDRWMLRLLGMPERPSDSEFTEAKRAIMSAAMTCGEYPRDLQATLWIQERGSGA